MENLITSIFDRLTAEVPELLFIDVDLGQLRMGNPPVAFPCALVDIANIEYRGGRMQTAETTVNVTLAFAVYGASTVGADATLRAEAMAHYAIIRKVAAALCGFRPENCAPLLRESLTRGNETYPRHFTMSFKTQHTETIK